MERLPESVYREFGVQGHWVLPKTVKDFSAMPLDQAHEQNNEKVKGSGGAVGQDFFKNLSHSMVLKNPMMTAITTRKVSLLRRVSRNSLRI